MLLTLINIEAKLKIAVAQFNAEANMYNSDANIFRSKIEREKAEGLFDIEVLNKAMQVDQHTLDLDLETAKQNVQSLLSTNAVVIGTQQNITEQYNAQIVSVLQGLNTVASISAEANSDENSSIIFKESRYGKYTKKTKG